MANIEIILTNCINEIKSGKATLAECLNRYPALRSELEPLLKLALNIQAPPDIKLDAQYKQAARARLLQQIRPPQEKKSRSFADILSLGIPRSLAPARIAISVIVIVILLSALAGGTAYASQSSLPGDLLYPVKIATEDARILIAGDNITKAELNLRFAQTRLEEMGKLASDDEFSDESDTKTAINGYRKNMEAARQQVGNITDNSTVSFLLNKALADIQDHIAFCDNILDGNPENPGAAREASTLSTDTQAEFLKMLGEHDIVQAAQANLNAMQNRLERAQNKANEDKYQEMQGALNQYQQLSGVGEDILQNAQNTSNHDDEIEELSLESLTEYEDTLEAISQEVPQEFQDTITESREKTEKFRNRAHDDNHPQNNNPGPQSENHGNSVTPDTQEHGQPAQNPGEGNGNTGNTAPELTATITPSPSSTPAGQANSNNNGQTNNNGNGHNKGK
jgi:hypothetical protein